MSRIETTFKSIQDKNKKALITYIVAGDPSHEQSLKAMHDCVLGGADILEIGMPFTDPMADGPIIQEAHLRALANGASLKTTLDLISKFRQDNKNTPIILMGYANPINAYKIDKFFEDAKNAGIDGVLIVDVPPEEDEEWVLHARKNEIDFIRLATPTTDENRLKKILKNASGFLYYVSIAGITGAATSNADAIKDHVSFIRSQTILPVAIGFGIQTRHDAVKMSKLADGIVVGSALIKALHDKQPIIQTVKEFRI